MSLFRAPGTMHRFTPTTPALWPKAEPRSVEDRGHRNRAFSSIWPRGPPPESEACTGADHRMTGFELILPFLRPIEHLILDPDISEIMLNGPECVFIEPNGYLKPVPDVKLTEKSLMIAVKNIARRLGDDISEAKPILDSRLPDGSRVAAVIPPSSVNGVTLTIRKFNAR